MQTTIKKFIKDPQRYLKKAPLIIVRNHQPEFAIIPYVVYKAKFEQQEQIEIHQNTLNAIETKTKKKSYLWRLLFE